MSITHKLVIKKDEFKKVFKDNNDLNGTKIKIGLFGDGKPDKNVAARGAIHEFGIPNGIKITEKMRRYLHAIGIHVKTDTQRIYIPARPFERKAFDKNVNNLIIKIGKLYKLLLNNKITIWRFLRLIGVLHESEIKLSIKSGDFKRLHPMTVKRKKSSKPLIDTGIMLNSVKHKITKGGNQ